jgi:hypothetical protein
MVQEHLEIGQQVQPLPPRVALEYLDNGRGQVEPSAQHEQDSSGGFRGVRGMQLSAKHLVDVLRILRRHPHLEEPRLLLGSERTPSHRGEPAMHSKAETMNLVSLLPPAFNVPDLERR